MKFLAVHPGPLMYTKIYLRLEPLGLEMVAQACRQAGHDVRLIDLQADTWKDYEALLTSWKPDVVAFGCNYLANVPEIVDLAKLTKSLLPNAFVFVGGHSASFVAKDFLQHADGALDHGQLGEARVGDEQRPRHAERLARVGQFGDAHGDVDAFPYLPPHVDRLREAVLQMLLRPR